MKKLKSKIVINLLWLIFMVAFGDLNVSGKEVTGVVVNQHHQVIPNALIIHGQSQVYSDDNGRFKINSALLEKKLIISKTGYTTVAISSAEFKNDTLLLISLIPERIKLLNTEKDSDKLSEAVSSLSGSKVENLPGTNRLNSFAGQLSGLLIMQRDGQPGWEDANVFIRGQNTLGGSVGVLRNSPTILVDGYETDISLLDPYDIESITVLKDAAATAIYGLRSGNGVILINTRKGKEGALRVNINSQTSVAKPDKFPELSGAGTYAELYNEALINDGLMPRYSSQDIANFKDGSDPLRYPDNDFIGDYFSKSFIQTRNNINISGGNNNVNYYFALGHLYNTGLLKTEQNENSYNTNTDLNVLNLHGKVDVQVSSKLNVNMDIKAKKDTRNQPGTFNSNGVSEFISQIMSTPPGAYPIFLAADSLGGNTDFTNNLYGQLNKSGYSIWERYYLSGALDFKYDIVNQLAVIGAFGYSVIGDHIIDRSKSFAVYEFRDDAGGINKLGDDTPMLNSSRLENVSRFFTTELGLSFTANIGEASIESKLMAERRMNEMNLLRIPHWYQGIKGRLDYQLNSRYFASFVFSYQGSEQFPAGNRYGFFPAGSLAWVISNSNLLYLKLRGSAGITGNDFDSFLSPVYFSYLERYGTSGNYHFGTEVSTPGIILRKVAENNSDITWSKTSKYDIGIDASLFNRSISVTADYFKERTDDILVGGTPGMVGIEFLYPYGIVDNSGVEGNVTWKHEITSDFNMYLSANGTYAVNKVIDQNEETYEYEWQQRTGHPVGSRFGYVFDRFFTEADDFETLPDQSALGTVIPGSLKYKDLNGDNMIDERDITYLEKGSLPEIWYGFSGGFDIKGVDLNFNFIGITNRTIMYSSHVAYALNNNAGSINDWHLDRWQPGDGQNASYPSLSIYNFGNNKVPSSFWIANGNFLRLHSVQVGYTMPKSFIKKIGLENLRFFVNGSNLYTWSEVKRIDPGAGQNFGGTSYPIAPTCTGGFNLTF